MALRQLFVHDGETLQDAIRRENIEAPNGRCGDHQKLGDYPGCGEPLAINTEYLVCPDFPDCCRP